MFLNYMYIYVHICNLTDKERYPSQSYTLQLKQKWIKMYIDTINVACSLYLLILDYKLFFMYFSKRFFENKYDHEIVHVDNIFIHWKLSKVMIMITITIMHNSISFSFISCSNNYLFDTLKIHSFIHLEFYEK